MPENLLLAALPREERSRLGPFLEPVEVKLQQLIFAPNEPITHVYFPFDFVTSTVHEMRGGESVEVGLMGVEGLVGIPVWLRQRTTPTRAIVLVPGRGLRMPAALFLREVVHKASPLNDLAAAYAHAFLVMTAQVAACNRLHSMDQRLCRWFLLVYHRVRSTEFVMTQDFMAQMLGVHRPTVSTTASLLQQAGLISYNRGRVTVTNHEGLKAGACECLQLMEAQFDKIFDGSWRELAGREDRKL